MCAARGDEPFSIPIGHGLRSPLLLHSPRPFHPVTWQANGASIVAAFELGASSCEVTGSLNHRAEVKDEHVCRIRRMERGTEL
jgi:hypothetical protein